jgi:hypothetical protein
LKPESSSFLEDTPGILKPSTSFKYLPEKKHEHLLIFNFED